MGDGVLVYFGYPHAHEDDAEQAVRAGLELVAAVAGLKTRAPQQIRVGIATGLVVVGHLISPESESPSSARRRTLRRACKVSPSRTWSSSAKAREGFSATSSSSRTLGCSELKGISAPVQAWAVLQPSSSTSRFEALHPTGMTALVGREEEYESAAAPLGKAKDGEGQVVLLSGEAGIGKSHLTAAFMELLAGEPHTRLRCFCSPQHTNSALHPIIGHIERAAGLARDDTAQTKLDKLDALLRQSSTSAAGRRALRRDAVAAERWALSRARADTRSSAGKERWTRSRANGALSGPRPVLIVFEDAHWADPTSLEVFGRPLTRIRGHRALLIVTFRPEFEPPWIGQPHVTALTLSRLAIPARSSVLIDQIVGNKPLPANIRQDIIERTDGIPLFVEEMTKAVLEAECEDEARRTAVLGPSPAMAVPRELARIA